MKTFNLKCGFTINCDSKKTRNGFKHVATLRDKDYRVLTTNSAHYLNRTWESFEYETVIRGALNKCKLFDEAAVRFIMDRLNDEARGRVSSMFKSAGLMARVGELFTGNQSEANDWKARMLKAGIPGLSMPDDWSSLTEDEKQGRLDKVIKECGV